MRKSFVLSLFVSSLLLMHAQGVNAQNTRNGRGEVKVSFETESGEYEDPDLVISNGKRKTPPPTKLGCNESYVIYSVVSKTVKSCDEYSGEAAGLNELCSEALAFANGAVDDIGCPEDCPGKSAPEIYRGWECLKELTLLDALCAVEVTMTCQIIG